MPTIRLYLCSSHHLRIALRWYKHQILIKVTFMRRQQILWPVMLSTTKRHSKFYQNPLPSRSAQIRYRRAYLIQASSQVRRARSRLLLNRKWQSYSSPTNLSFSHLHIKASISCPTARQEAALRQALNLTKLRKVVRFFCLRALSHFYSTKCQFWCSKTHHKVSSWYWDLRLRHNSLLRVL